MRPDPATAARRGLALVLAVACAAGVGALWAAFVRTARGQNVEELARLGATKGQGRLWQLAEPVLDVVSVGFVVLGLAVAVGIALVRRRWWLAAQVAVMVVGANVTTQVVKAALPRPHVTGGWTGANTLPSGHTTVAAAVSAALVLAVPRRARPWVAVLGAVYTALTGVSTLVGQWHRPSDVVAALLVVAAWTCLVCGLTPASARDPQRWGPDGVPVQGRGSWVAVFVLLAGAGLAGVVAASSLHDVVAAVDAAAGTLRGIGRETQIAAYIGGALGVVAATGAVFALVLAVRQLTSAPPAHRAAPAGTLGRTEA